MQFKADVTKEELINSGIDPLFETHFSISKLKAIAAFLESYSPETGTLDAHDKKILEGTAFIIEDAAEEIEYLIEASNEQYHQRKKENSHGND